MSKKVRNMIGVVIDLLVMGWLATLFIGILFVLPMLMYLCDIYLGNYVTWWQVLLIMGSVFPCCAWLKIDLWHDMWH